MTNQSKQTESKDFKLLDTLEAREMYEAALRKWDKKLKPLTDAIRRSQQITSEDLNIRVGPCHD